MANYQLTASDRVALAWRINEDPDAYVARIEANFPNAAEVIAHKIAVCKEKRAAATDKRPRAEREAEELAALQPTPLQIELMRARAYAQLQADLAAAKKLGLKLAEAELDRQAAGLAAKEE